MLLRAEPYRSPSVAPGFPCNRSSNPGYCGSQVAPLPVVTADSLTPGMEYPKDDSSPHCRDLRGGRSFRWDAVPCG